MNVNAYPKMTATQKKRAQEIVKIFDQQSADLKSLDNATISAPIKDGFAAQDFPIDSNLSDNKVYLAHPVGVGDSRIAGTAKFYKNGKAGKSESVRVNADGSAAELKHDPSWADRYDAPKYQYMRYETFNDHVSTGNKTYGTESVSVEQVGVDKKTGEVLYYKKS